MPISKRKESLSIRDKLETEGLNGIYYEIAQILSYEDSKILFDNLKGLSVNFPTKFVDPDYIKKYICTELMEGKVFTKADIQKMSLRFDYSERQMRRFIKEVKLEHFGALEE